MDKLLPVIEVQKPVEPEPLPDNVLPESGDG